MAKKLSERLGEKVLVRTATVRGEETFIFPEALYEWLLELSQLVERHETRINLLLMFSRETTPKDPDTTVGQADDEIPRLKERIAELEPDAEIGRLVRGRADYTQLRGDQMCYRGIIGGTTEEWTALATTIGNPAEALRTIQESRPMESDKVGIQDIALRELRAENEQLRQRVVELEAINADLKADAEIGELVRGMRKDSRLVRSDGRYRSIRGWTTEIWTQLFDYTDDPAEALRAIQKEEGTSGDQG